MKKAKENPPSTGLGAISNDGKMIVPPAQGWGQEGRSRGKWGTPDSAGG